MGEKQKTSLNVDSELFKLLKIKAALEDVSITEAFEEAIRRYTEDVLPHVSKLTSSKRKP
jgi:DNA-binding protein YbaB